MASFVVVKKTVLSAAIATGVLSGTVTLDGTPVSRRILVYKNKGVDLYGETSSDSSGNFSITVAGGGADQFRVICVGEPGENSKVHEGVRLT